MFYQWQSLQRWELNFVATKAKELYTTILVEVSQLPTEFYDGEVLKRIGKIIGRLLKVNACTSLTLRHHYARVCVKLPLNEPVNPYIYIESHKQLILYEGDKLMCKNCGHLGHVAGPTLSSQYLGKTNIIEL